MYNGGMKELTFGSLFTGVGGFDLGFETAGMKCLWQCEIDEHCNQVLEEHWKGVKRYNDVREITKENTERVDLICGGFPCQDLSVAGKRAGLAGERSGLWYEFARIIGELKPRWVVIENVPGLLSSRRGADFRIVIEGLEECGYGVAWRILDSQYFGVPQRRRRIFIVASLGNADCGKVLFELKHFKECKRMEESRESIASCLRARGDGELHGGAKFFRFDKRIRFITPTECERLQGFPDGWTASQSDTQRYKQMGNAVSVPVIKWIGSRIVGT